MSSSTLAGSGCGQASRKIDPHAAYPLIAFGLILVGSVPVRIIQTRRKLEDDPLPYLPTITTLQKFHRQLSNCSLRHLMPLDGRYKLGHLAMHISKSPSQKADW